MVIDNTIVMTDHIRRRHDLKAFLSILAATLTTIGALVIIFFLDERIRLNLQDFAAVVIINLAVSLFIALFLVPALIEKLKLGEKKKRINTETQRHGVLFRWSKNIKSLCHRVAVFLKIYFTRYYKTQIRFLCQWKKMACVVLVLAFGLPVFLLPEKIEYDEKKFYSHTDSLSILIIKW